MNVIVEFLDDEPINNVVTCLNYRMDKAIFFGEHEMLQRQKTNTENFLRKYCHVSEVVFHPLSRTDLQSVLQEMRKWLQRERDAGNDLYFDITGGDTLYTVAFGMLSREYRFPMHLFDVERGKIVELDEGAEKEISRDVPSQFVVFDIDAYVELLGGTVNEKMHKDFKEIDDIDLIDRMWQVSSRAGRLWNAFAHFLQAHFPPEGSLSVSIPAEEVWQELDSNLHRGLNEPDQLKEILFDCADAEMLLDVRFANGEVAYTYPSESMQSCLMDAGSILELHVYTLFCDSCDDCRVGVHLDWDGVIEGPGNDVLNEIDVLGLQCYVPLFISCKNGHADRSALYELESVARRFGGKHAKKILVASGGLADIDRMRAEQMGIQVITE